MLKKTLIILILFIITSLSVMLVIQQIKSVFLIPSNSINKHANNLGNLIDKDFSSFIDDITYILESENLYSYLQDPKKNSKTDNRIRQFYKKYKNLIKTIFIYDTKKTVKILYTEDDHYLVNQAFIKNEISYNPIFQKQYDLIQYIEIIKDSDKKIKANIEIILDMETYIKNKMISYNPGNIYWSFLLLQNKVKIFNSDDKSFPDLDILYIDNIENLINNQSVNTIKTQLYYENKKYRIEGAFYSLQSVKLPYTIFIAFHHTYITKHVILVITPIVFISLLFSLLLFKIISQKNKKIESLSLSQSENYIIYKNLLENSPIGIIEYIEDNDIIDINSIAQEILRVFFVDDFYLDKCNKIIQTQFLPLFENLKQNLNKSKDITLLIYTKEVHIKRYVIEHFKLKNSYLIFITDNNINYRNSKLINEMQKTKFGFLTNLSHELKTPITSIINFTNILFNEVNNDKKHEFLNQISIASNKLLEVSNNILRFSTLELNNVNIDYIPTNLISLFKPLITDYKLQCNKKNIEFLYEYDDNIEIILIDQNIILNIIKNILSNALKFTHYGKIQLRIFKTKNFDLEDIIRFEVSDSGIGIDKAKQDKIFKPFFQGDTNLTRSYGGSGLGLSIAYKLTNLLNGNIYLFKSDQSGSCFIVELPYTINQII